jgi:hypothetical protein
MLSTHVCSHFQHWWQPFLYGEHSDIFSIHLWSSQFTNGDYYYTVTCQKKYLTSLPFHYFNVKMCKNTGMYQYIPDPQLMNGLCLKTPFLTKSHSSVKSYFSLIRNRITSSSWVLQLMSKDYLTHNTVTWRLKSWDNLRRKVSQQQRANIFPWQPIHVSTTMDTQVTREDCWSGIFYAVCAKQWTTFLVKLF